MQTRKLTKEEYEGALALAWAVFQQFEAPDYSEQGAQSFYTAIHDPEYIAQLCMYGAFVDGRLVGVLATRSEGDHIALFFVDGTFHRRGIGKSLFLLAREDNTSGKLTVNSSPYATEIYHHLGFRDTAKEQVTDGIRFTPMELRLKDS